MSPSILQWMDRAILVLDGIKEIIPGKVDDFVVEVLKFLRNDQTFMGWLGADGSDEPGGLPPLPLMQALHRFQAANPQAELSPTQWLEIAQMVMKALAWIKARRAQQPAA